MSSGVPRSPKDLLPVLIFLVTLAYPFLVYLNIDSIEPGWFGVVLLLLAVFRLVVTGTKRQSSDWLITVVIAVFCSVIIILESEILLKCYPVMMSLAMGLVFLAQTLHNLGCAVIVKWCSGGLDGVVCQSGCMDLI